MIEQWVHPPSFDPTHPSWRLPAVVVHEAGHLIAGAEVGLEPVGASVSPVSDPARGVHFNGAVWVAPWPGPTARQTVIATAAGAHAQSEFLRMQPDSQSYEGDLSIMMRTVARSGGDWRSLAAAAGPLVRRLMPRILRLAREIAPFAGRGMIDCTTLQALMRLSW